ncbi:DUF1905 domain-containing protein [Spiroplasma sp. AdecLV25b]|uniref:DUF1905 domain-containing protein n=1 Tax=Spiroplasma sp. AdecLV25b TaxID=3027162 RepID=UPI0027DFB4D5|nr:DUF1905 domain-containing protein [Spiroplasma sp. AdecLV25b]
MIQQKFYKFNATIMNTYNKNGHLYSYIELPFTNLQNEFGKKRLIPVQITFDNSTKMGSIINSNDIIPIIIISNNIKTQIQKVVGDDVDINLHYDNEPEALKLPKYLLKMLFKQSLFNQWNQLTIKNKKELITLWKLQRQQTNIEETLLINLKNKILTETWG